MKEITWLNVNSIWFEVELLKIKELNKFNEDLDSIRKTQYHLENEVFTVSNSRDTCYLAQALLTRDDDYNYALIYM